MTEAAATQNPVAAAAGGAAAGAAAAAATNTAAAAAITATAAPPAAAAALAVEHTGSHLQHPGLAAGVTSENQKSAGHTFQDTAAVTDAVAPGVADSGTFDGCDAADSDRPPSSSLATPPSWQCRLYHGCCIAAEIKAAVAAETQYRWDVCWCVWRGRVGDFFLLGMQIDSTLLSLFPTWFC